MTNKSAGALRTIGEVADELDVATHVLRFWESKFHQIKPQKRRGRRYYRPEDVEVITKIKELLYEQGYTIRGVQKYLVAEAKKKTSSNQSVAPTAQPAPKPAAVQSSALQQPNVLAARPQAAAPSFKTDMFGNIIPANGPVPASPLAPSRVPAQEANASYSKDDIAKLKQIHSGLQAARERLRNIA